jgi:predicted DNA-binding transcriptional regulator AlpA
MDKPTSGTELIGGIFEPLDANSWHPLKDAKEIFQTGPTHTRKLIEQGVIPPPIKLSPRSHGWTGAMINEHRRKIAEQYKQQQTARQTAEA